MEPRHSVVVYYDRDGILITDRVVLADGVLYRIAELSRPVRETGSLHPGVRFGVGIGVANAVVLGTSATALHSAAGWLLTAVALVIPCCFGLYYAVSRPRQLRLLAEHQGERVTLLRTGDPREFGQVARALQRALEANNHRGL